MAALLKPKPRRVRVIGHAIFELLLASASNGRKLAWSERFDVIHMPRNARFDCAASEEEEVSEEKEPATSKTLCEPAEII